MAGVTMWDLQDRRYLRRDGENSMSGPLLLSGGDPSLANEAANKAYVDTLTRALPTNAQVAAAIAILTNPGGTIDAHIAAALLAYLLLAGGVMTGPLTLAGAPVNPLDAATKGYADLMLPLVGGTLTGALTLPGAPANALHAATKGYADLMLPLLGGVLTGALTLAGAPVNPLEAATKGYADLMLPLGGGTLTGALTLAGAPVNALHAATKEYADSVATLPTYDAVVAAAGGDYTSVETACATEAVGARIFIKSGTYNETGSVVMQDGQMLIGENREDTIIDFGAANRKITCAGGLSNVAVENLTVQGSTMDYTVELGADQARVVNNLIIGTGASNSGVILTGAYSVLEKNHIIGFSRPTAFGAVLGDHCTAYGNSFLDCDGGLKGSSYCVIVSNRFDGVASVHLFLDQLSLAVGNMLVTDGTVQVSGSNVLISGNYITGASGIEWDAHMDFVTITGNHFKDSGITCVYINSTDITITGNTFTDGHGLLVEGDRFTISGNTFEGTAFISLSANCSQASVVGNNLAGSTAAPKILDLGVANMAINNFGVDSLSEKDFRRMKNTSGGDLVAGDVVVLKAVAAGDEVTTTVNQGDDMVFGMVEDATLANAAYGYIQGEGKTVKLKVNGTVNIGIGDLLGTLDAAKIAMKAAAGDMAFAIALEAYAGADSDGVIDALLIKPRKV